VKKGIILIGDLFEETEALVTRNILLRAGMDVSLVSTSSKLECLSSNGLKIETKYLISEVNTKDFDFIAIAGGAWVSELIKKPSTEQFRAIIDLVHHFAELKKTVAAICAAPVGMNLKRLIALSILGGIGFTVSLFIANLSYDDPSMLALLNEAKLGIFVGTIISGIVGYALLHYILPKREHSEVSETH